MTESDREFMHALGNHLNAALMLAEDLGEQVSESHLQQLCKANGLLSQNRNRLPEFFRDGEKGALLVAYYLEVEAGLVRENKTLVHELSLLTKELGAMRDLLLSQK